MFTPLNAEPIYLGRSLFIWGSAYLSGAAPIYLGQRLLLWGGAYLYGVYPYVFLLDHIISFLL
jgi:hypothetical protein